jgi:hypothetical protein
MDIDSINTSMNPELQAKHLAAVASHRTKNEKLAWKRKINKMMGFLADAHEFEERILELMRQKQPVMDSIAELRAEMIKECVHPRDHLVHMNTHIVCKFCENKISIPRIISTVAAVEDEEEDVGE